MNTPTLKAIETVYNGYRFRSRLEARWAVFFDALGCKYEYEKEGYDLGEAGLYLPDFWLPEQKYWIEIKGAKPTDHEQELAVALAIASGHRAYIFFGDIPGSAREFESDSAYVFFPDDGGDVMHTWCACKVCGVVGIHFGASADRLCGCGKSIWNGDEERINRAYAAARAARFEHGERSR